MKPASIVLAVLVVVAVSALVWMLGPGATWVLEHVDHVTVFKEDKDRAAALTAIRGNILAVATGLAALGVVFYTARNADTARRMFRLGERGHDTDRYGKAVEQLGHATAPVRLGGLYALEQLAADNPRVRQTVVDVLCAYLRMPYTPDTRVGRIRALQRAARSGTARPGQQAQEEEQVRLTAQRILADHLRHPAPAPRRWWQHPAPAPARFWKNIRLDLTGATLLRLDFATCQMSDASFSGADFTGDAIFDQAHFASTASFSGAHFAGTASFSEADFTGDAIFDQAHFAGAAWFREAHFAATGFSGARFVGVAHFHEAHFAGDASFSRAHFTGSGWFAETHFAGTAWFSEADFTGDAIFDQAHFAGTAWFRKAHFTDFALFSKAHFTGDADFCEAHFASFDIVSFDGVSGQEHVDLEGARVVSPRPGAQYVWPPGWHLEPGPDGAETLRRVSTGATGPIEADAPAKPEVEPG